jgi:menaquinone reductase, multiheme cytochrome c subunit
MLRTSSFFIAGFIAALAAGWLAFPKALYRSHSQPLQFSHVTHAGEKGGMQCQDCHTLGEDGTFSGVPKLDKCSGCHGEVMGEHPDEKKFVEQYVAHEREVAWHVYSRQPDNAYFPHAAHMNLGKLTCETCHGDHGKTATLRPYQENRISGYSRDIWGTSISRFRPAARPTMKMSDCESCHRDKGVTTGCIACHK